MLDAGQEVALRRRLPAGVRLYTGDDFNYAELIGATPTAHSDALLGAFAAITAPAAAALHALDARRPGRLRRGDRRRRSRSAGRSSSRRPTTTRPGVAFLAWLNGLQPHFAMLGGLQRQRPAGHLIRVFELAAAAGALTEPELAVERMSEMLARSADA